MTHAVGRRPVLLAALLLAAGISFGCDNRRPEGNAIVVAITNSPLTLDPCVGSDEASQKAHQLLYNTLLRIDDDLQTVPELLEPSDRYHGGRPANDGVVMKVVPDDTMRGLELRKGVRRAIGFAIDRDAMVKYLRRGFASVALGIVPPMSWAFERDVFAQDVPYVSLWYKTNVAVFQPELRGVHLSPIADFTFLKDVARDPGVARP